ncbi:MAG: preprotein translocase subunit YajC [Treponemataceae bacterium]|nr:preprotein translocase subunit YajC [Treponemataceae bacterium]
MPFISFLQTAQGTAGSASSTTSFVSTIVPFVLIILIFYFFLIRPQNKKQKETEKMIAALKKGDKVVTIGGIHGVVSSTKEKTVVVKVDDSTKLEFSRSAIASVESDKPAELKDGRTKEPKAKIEKKESDGAPSAEDESGK